jgi:hypothetical protein
MKHAVLICVLFGLAACSGAEAPAPSVAPAPAPAPAPVAPPTDYAGVVAHPDAAKGVKLDLRLGLVAGDYRMIDGSIVTPTGQAWRDPSGKDHAIAPPPGFAVGPSCIFVVVDSDAVPLLPLQPVVEDLHQPCDGQSSFKTVRTIGEVVEVRATQLSVDGKVVTMQAPVLNVLDYISPMQ